jgi:hypothetical protein
VAARRVRSSLHKSSSAKKGVSVFCLGRPFCFSDLSFRLSCRASLDPHFDRGANTRRTTAFTVASCSATFALPLCFISRRQRNRRSCAFRASRIGRGIYALDLLHTLAGSSSCACCRHSGHGSRSFGCLGFWHFRSLRSSPDSRVLSTDLPRTRLHLHAGILGLR